MPDTTTEARVLKAQPQHVDNLTIMNRRFSIFFLALALVVAACNGQTTTETTNTTATTSPGNTAPGGSVPEATALSYTLAAGQVFVFEVDLNQTVEMTATGDASAMGEGDMPGEMSLVISGTAVITYEIAPGPETDTFAVTITGDFSDLEFSGTVDGESVDADDVPEMAQLEPIDVTIVVDSNGRLIQEPTDGFDDLFGGFGALEDMFSSGMNFGSFFGPPFGDDEVTVGDTWTETTEIPGMGDEPLVAEIESTVTGTETLDGATVYVIDTVTSTPLIEFDLAEMIIGMLEAFLQFGSPSEEELAEFYELTEQIRFAFRVEPSSSNMTTWFDQEAGITRQLEMDATTEMTFDIRVPDEETDEMVSFSMEMKTTQSTRQRLVSSTGL